MSLALFFQELMINATENSAASITTTMTPRELTETQDQVPNLLDTRPSSALNGSLEKPNPRSPERKKTSTPVAPTAEEDEEWSKLRCGSLCTEEIARKEKQKEDRKNRQNRCADYPGFAFGSAMFGSDTTMKFNIIKNELHNIMRSQLKRVDGEVKALSSRIKEFDAKLEESEKYIREATNALSEAVAIQIEESKNRSEEDEQESNLSSFDQHVLFLEGQLKEARIKARLSFQILENCDQEQSNLLSKTSPPAVAADVKPTKAELKDNSVVEEAYPPPKENINLTRRCLDLSPRKISSPSPLQQPNSEINRNRKSLTPPSDPNMYTQQTENTTVKSKKPLRRPRETFSHSDSSSRNSQRQNSNLTETNINNINNNNNNSSSIAVDNVSQDDLNANIPETTN